jgi:hypothetical protein
MGYDRLREALCARLGIGLGETTADGRAWAPATARRR